MERQHFHQLGISLNLRGFCSRGDVLEILFGNKILESSRDWAGLESSLLHPLFSVKTMKELGAGGLHL
jgi:hypothetical protein